MSLGGLGSEVGHRKRSGQGRPNALKIGAQRLRLDMLDSTATIPRCPDVPWWGGYVWSRGGRRLDIKETSNVSVQTAKRRDITVDRKFLVISKSNCPERQRLHRPGWRQLREAVLVAAGVCIVCMPHDPLLVVICGSLQTERSPATNPPNDVKMASIPSMVLYPAVSSPNN